MKHLAAIQTEFLKEARKWDDLTRDEQQAYLKRHPKTKRRLTARPDQSDKSKIDEVKSKLDKVKSTKQPDVLKIMPSGTREDFGSNGKSFNWYKRGGYAGEKSINKRS
jgi:hypothetical protein